MKSSGPFNRVAITGKLDVQIQKFDWAPPLNMLSIYKLKKQNKKLQECEKRCNKINGGKLVGNLVGFELDGEFTTTYEVGPQPLREIIEASREGPVYSSVSHLPFRRPNQS